MVAIHSAGAPSFPFRNIDIQWYPGIQWCDLLGSWVEDFAFDVSSLQLVLAFLVILQLQILQEDQLEQSQSCLAARA